MENTDRKQRIVRDSLIGIVVNVLIAAVKILIGALANSLAIISEGMNNAADAGSSLLTLVGTKLSAKHPDQNHPFGYGRIEYLTSLIVSMLILYTGISLVRSSVDGIIHPAEMEVTVIAILIVAVSAVIKFFLGIFMMREGRKTESSALIAVGTEGRNDSFFSLVTIASSLIFLFGHVSVDAWAGLLFSAVILKSGIEILKDTVSELIGRPGKKELASKLYQEIRAQKGVLNVADMMLHNYGPDSYSGSVNIEVDYRENIGEVYESLHELQLSIMKKYQVTMVFGIYAVDNDREASRELRLYIGRFVGRHPHLQSYHALYQSKSTNTIYCDFVVDYELENWDGLRKEFETYMKEKYPAQKIDLTIETEFV